MQPTLCSRCHKNVAVIFIQKLEGGATKSEGLCLKCAKEMGIKPVEDMMQKMGITDEDLEGLTNEMMSAFGGAEGMEGLVPNEEGDQDEEDEGKTATFPFLNKLFGSAQNPQAQPPERDSSRQERGDKEKKVSMRTMTLDNKKQKVNDQLGNPVEIGAVVIWKVVNPTKAVINVENYKNYLSIQCDSIIRNTARQYPYDTSEGADEKSLRGSSQEIADIMSKELQEKTEDAGIKILDVRITHLAYAPEIASAMLQRQQAAAIIDARQKIVEGAVGMVEMALSRLNEKEIVELDEERKAAMVSNLMVVLCGNKDAQPIVNSGSLY